MTGYTVRIHNVETDDFIDRPMTAEEIAEFEAALANAPANAPAV